MNECPFWAKGCDDEFELSEGRPINVERIDW